MIGVPAHAVRQFGVEFYQAAFSAADIERLVRFEVLSYAGEPERAKGRQRSDAFGINWELLEQRIAHTETAFQRPLIRRKIQEWKARLAGGTRSTVEVLARELRDLLHS